MRTSVRQSYLLIPVLVVLTAGLVACTQEDPGQATGQESTRPTASGDPFPTKSTRTSAPGTTKGPLASKDPCSLLSSTELASLGLTAGKQENLGEGRGCFYQKSGEFAATVGIYDELGLKDIVPTGPVKPESKIGQHRSVEYTGGIDSCVYAMELTPTSRVDASAAARGDATKSCQIAQQLAKIVEMKLP